MTVLWTNKWGMTKSHFSLGSVFFLSKLCQSWPVLKFSGQFEPSQAKKSFNNSFNLYSLISVIFQLSRDIVVVVIRYPLLVIKYNINMAQFHSFHLFTQFDLWIFAVMLWLKNDRLKFNLVWIIEHYLEWFLQPILRPNNVH